MMLAALALILTYVSWPDGPQSSWRGQIDGVFFQRTLQFGQSAAPVRLGRHAGCVCMDAIARTHPNHVCGSYYSTAHDECQFFHRVFHIRKNRIDKPFRNCLWTIKWQPHNGNYRVDGITYILPDRAASRSNIINRYWCRFLSNCIAASLPPPGCNTIEPIVRDSEWLTYSPSSLLAVTSHTRIVPDSSTAPAARPGFFTIIRPNTPLRSRFHALFS